MTAEHGTLTRYTDGRCRCDQCRAAKTEHQRAYRDANKEKCAAIDRAYYEANKDKFAARNRARRAAGLSKEQDAAYARRRRQDDATRLADDQRAAAWRRNNPVRRRQAEQRRRARAARADIRLVTPRDWARLAERFRGCCAYCGRRERLTEDHVVPLSRGGRHSIGNLLPACAACNSSKKDRLLVEWVRSAQVDLRLVKGTGHAQPSPPGALRDALRRHVA